MLLVHCFSINTHNYFSFVLFCKSVETPNDDPLEVSDNFVLRCQQGQTISVQSATTACSVDFSEQARLVVFMLQAAP